LIRKMCRENPGWGAPRIHGELLKLGIDIGERSVSKYMVRCRKPPSQAWRTFLENHAQQLVSIDFFTVPTIRIQVLYVFLVLAHDRRRDNLTRRVSYNWMSARLLGINLTYEKYESTIRARSQRSSSPAITPD